MANNQISGECQLRTYSVNHTKKLLVFEMNIATGYFGINKISRTLFMLIHKFENPKDSFVFIDQKIKVSYNITYRNEKEVISVFSVINNISSQGDKFSLYFSADDKSEYKYVFQILYSVILMIYHWTFF